MKKITRWDVFFTLVDLRNEKHKPISISEIQEQVKASRKSIYNQLRTLQKMDLIVKTTDYLPKVNLNPGSKFKSLINVHQFAIKNNVNYNILLSKNFFKIISYNKSTLRISDIKSLHYETFKKYLSLMLKLSFAMILKQKPLKIRLLHHIILQDLFIIHGKTYNMRTNYFTSKDEEFYLKSISELLEKVKLKSAKFKKMNKKQRILFIMHTTQLEGNPMQFTEVKDLIENNKTLNLDKISVRENKNIDDALNIMSQFAGQELDLKKINKIHYQVQKYINKSELSWKKIAGKIRTIPVKISNNPEFEMCKPKELKVELSKFINKFNSELNQLKKLNNTPLNLQKKIKFATWVHSEFQHIHPYIDGNSRTTRILFNYVLIEFGLPLTDIYFVKEYIDVTKGEVKRDDNKLYLFFLHLIYDNLLRLTSES